MKCFKLISIVYVLALSFGGTGILSIYAVASESTYTPIPPPTCTANPGCPACGSCSCTDYRGKCTDQFTVMPGVSGIAVNTIPLVRNYTDTPSGPCGSDNRICNGGTTSCKVNKLPTVLDAVLTQWDPDVRRLPASSVTCKYYDPVCSPTCCVSWSCSCVPCS